MQVARLAIAEHEAAGQTVRGRHHQPLARGTGTALDVAQLVLEGADGQTEAILEAVEGDLVAAQGFPELLAQGS